ncbi:hypothetical protein ACMFMG_001217 [Clarireedia jacksonii]
MSKNGHAPPHELDSHIYLCRKLHIRYLWIDKLCIVQRDKDDRVKQGSNMANIYQNSFLTIAASAARNDGETLYRVMDEETAKVVELTGSTNDGKPYQIFARCPVKHYLDGIADTEDFPEWPLVRRA